MHRNRAQDYGRITVLDAFKSAGIALGVVAADGTLLHTNDAWSGNHEGRQVPLALQATPGTPCTTALRAAAQAGNELAIRTLDGIAGVIDGRIESVSCEFVESTPEMRWFELSISGLHAHRGAVISSMDVTARKRAAAATAGQIDEVARNARVTTMSLLAASAGHELTQPLVSIMSNAETALIKLRGKSEHVQRIREMIIDISRAATRATEIIHRMRQLFSGAAPERLELSVNRLVRDVVSLLGDDALRQRVHLDFTLDQSEPCIYGDPIQLQQVLINLITNAIEVTVNASPAERVVHVTTQHLGSLVEVHVNDHGPALEPAALNRIFEPLYTTKRSGMGLGLYITRAIVESHGGHIHAVSTGHGLSITVTLPLIAQSPLDHILPASIPDWANV